MPVLAASVEGPVARSIPSCVVEVGEHPKVLDLDTPLVVADVIHGHPGRDRPVVVLPHNSVREDHRGPVPCLGVAV